MKRFRTEPQHGTKSGYDWHKRQANNEPCEPCRFALANYWRTIRAERKQDINEKRRAWKLKHPYGDSQVTLIELIETYGITCYLCHEPIDLTATRQVGKPGWERGLHRDHVIPRSKGGPDTIENVRPTHARCNLEKWSKQ